MRIRDAVATFRGHRVPHVDFIGRRRWWFLLSGALIALSLVGLVVRGLNFSIDFTGGSLLNLPNPRHATAADYRSVMTRFGVRDAVVELIEGGTSCPSGCVSIRTKQSLTELGVAQSSTQTPTPTPTPTATPTPTSTATPTPTASASGSGATPSATPSATASPSAAPPLPVLKGDQLRAALARTAGVSVNQINEQDVGPTWGRTITGKALFALAIFLGLVGLYISFRFEPKMAAGALLALLHDVVITVGVYALVGREVTPESVIAFLTILGYSLYDTVVIYDKVKENTESSAMIARESYSGVVNISLNQTLMRSVNTSLVVLLPIGALLLFGGETLKNFAFALFVGVATGAYSSIFLAAPLLGMLKEREPRYQQLRARAQARAVKPGLRPAATSTARDGESTAVPGSEPASVGARSTAATTAPKAAPKATPKGRAGTPKKKGRPQGKAKPRRR